MRPAAFGALLLQTGITARQRTLYLIVTLGIAVAAWLLLAALAAPTLQGSSGTDPGVMVMNGNQGTPVLPLRYATRLAATPGAKAVSWTTVQTINCGPGSTIVTINAYGGPAAIRTMSAAARIGPAAIRRWSADPLGLIITDRTAKDCGWRVGEGITPASGTGASLAFHVAGIAHVAHAVGDTAYAHFAYINRTGSMAGKDQVINYTAYAADPRLNNLLAARIAEAFANEFPTVNAFTNTTVQGAWQRFGKIQDLLVVVMVAVLLCAASVLVTVFAHSAAQRRRTFALLQVFGFGRGALFATFGLEALAVVVLGAAFGIGAGSALQHILAHGGELAFMTAGFNIPNWAYWSLPVWLALLLIAALAWPALLVRRVRPADIKAS